MDTAFEGKAEGRQMNSQQDHRRDKSRQKRRPSKEKEEVERGIGKDDWPEMSLEDTGGEGGKNLLSLQLDPGPLFSILGTISNQIGMLRGEVLFVKKTANDMQNLRNEMKEYADNAKNELEEARKDMEDALHNAKEDMNRNLEDWKKQFDADAAKAKKDMDYSRDQISDAITEARRAATDFKSLQDGMKELHDRVDEVNNHAEDAIHRAENCQTGLCDLQQGMDALKRQLGGVEGEVERLSRPNSAIVKEMAHQEAIDPHKLKDLVNSSDFNALEKRLDSVEQRLDSVESGLNSKDRKLKKLEAGLKSMSQRAKDGEEGNQEIPEPEPFPVVDDEVLERVERLEAKCSELTTNLEATDHVVTREIARLNNELKPLNPLPENIHELRYDLAALKKELQDWAQKPMLAEIKKGSVEDLMFTEEEPLAVPPPPQVTMETQTSLPPEEPQTPQIQVVETIREIVKPTGPDQDEWLRGRMRPLFSAIEGLMSDSKTSANKLGDLRDRLIALEKNKEKDKYKKFGGVTHNELKAGLNALEANLGGKIAQVERESRRNSMASQVKPPTPQPIVDVGVDPARVDHLERDVNERLDALFDQVGNLFDMVGVLQETLGDTNALAQNALQKAKTPRKMHASEKKSGDVEHTTQIRKSIGDIFQKVYKMEIELNNLKKTVLGNTTNLEAVSQEVAEQDSKLTSISAQSNYLGSQVETLRNTLLKQIAQDIERLQEEKLDRRDLVDFATKNDVLNKADLSTLQHLEGRFDGFQAQMRRELDHTLQQLGQLQAEVQRQLNKYRDNLKKKLINAVKMVQSQNAQTSGPGTDIGRVGYKCVVCDQPTPMKAGIVPVQAPGLFPSQTKRTPPVQGMAQNIEGRDPVVFRGGFRMPGRSMNTSGVMQDAGERLLNDHSPMFAPATPQVDDYESEMVHTAREVMDVPHMAQDGGSRPTSAPAGKKQPLPPANYRGRGGNSGNKGNKAFITMQNM